MPTKRKPPAKDHLTRLHQWITIIGVPAGLAIAGWVGANFDTMRLDIVSLKTSIGFMQQDLGRHTSELENIQKTLAADEARYGH